MNFKSEKEMSELFSKYAYRFIKNTGLLLVSEVRGLFGIPDFVLFDKNGSNIYSIVAIELKLKNWRRALVQAYRYRAFANQSFVILDEAFCKNALLNLSMFEQYNVGLASFNNKNELKIYHIPNFETPFSLMVVKQLEKFISINVKPVATESNTFSFEQHYQFNNYYKRHTQ
jgi:hypothetical protein